MVPDLIETLGVLDDEDHAIVGQDLGCLCRGDPGGGCHFGNSHQLPDSHHVDFYVLVLPAKYFLLFNCLLGQFSQCLIILPLSGLEPAHQKFVLFSASVDVGQHIGLSLMFMDSQLGEAGIE